MLWYYYDTFQHRYMYFHQLLLKTTENYYFENTEDKAKTHEQYGKWVFGKYSEDENVDEELAAEICFQLLQGQSFELLVDYLRLKHVSFFSFYLKCTDIF